MSVRALQRDAKSSLASKVLAATLPHAGPQVQEQHATTGTSQGRDARGPREQERIFFWEERGPGRRVDAVSLRGSLPSQCEKTKQSVVASVSVFLVVIAAISKSIGSF